MGQVDSDHLDNIEEDARMLSSEIMRGLYGNPSIHDLNEMQEI